MPHQLYRVTYDVRLARHATQLASSITMYSTDGSFGTALSGGAYALVHAEG